MYNFEQTLELLGLKGLTEFFSILGFSSLIASVLYILMALGIFKMAKKTEIGKPWLSFIPIINTYMFGKVAQCYIKKDGTKSAKFGVALLVLNILKLVFVVLFIVALIITLISTVTLLYDAYDNDTSVTAEMFSPFISVIVLYFILLAIAVAYKIVYYVALWRIFAVFNSENATLFTVLSVFFAFLPGIFVFAIRNREPIRNNEL